MAHVAKYSGGAMGHMLAHYERTKEIDNIDPARSHLNYNMAAAVQPLPQLDYVHKRLSEVRVQNRKDVNKLCDWVVTVPKDLPESEHREFFEAVYSFLAGKYGEVNVVSAYVHMDEVTPHMHFAFLPIVADPRRNGEKLSAKEAITRGDLKQFHGELQTFVEARLGHTVGVLNEATVEGNKSIVELKRNSAIEEMSKARSEASEIVSSAILEAQKVRDRTVPLLTEYNALKLAIRRTECNDNPPGIERKKRGIFRKREYVTMPREVWEAQKVTYQTWRGVLDSMDELEKGINAFRASSSYEQMQKLEAKIDELEHKLRDMTKLKEHYQGEAEIMLDRVNAVIDAMPKIKAEFIEKWEAVLSGENEERPAHEGYGDDDGER